MGKTGATLKTVDTTKGILDLEFAYNTSKVSQIINAWSAKAAVDNISKAKINTYLDFIFLTFYALFLFFICKKVATLNTSKVGLLIAKGAILAGVLDIIENIGMLISLSGYPSNIVAIITTICASIKWVLAIVALIYLIIGIVQFIYAKKIGSLIN